MRTETFTTVPGSMASLRVKVCTSTRKKELPTAVTGRMTGSRALEGRYGPMAHTTRAVLSRASSMVKVRSDGNVATLTVASGWKASSTVEVSSRGQMASSMTEIGSKESVTE